MCVGDEGEFQRVPDRISSPVKIGWIIKHPYAVLSPHSFLYFSIYYLFCVTHSQAVNATDHPSHRAAFGFCLRVRLEMMEISLMWCLCESSALEHSDHSGRGTHTYTHDSMHTYVHTHKLRLVSAECVFSGCAWLAVVNGRFEWTFMIYGAFFCLSHRNGVSGSLAKIVHTVACVCVSAGLNQQEWFELYWLWLRVYAHAGVERI